MLTQPKKIAQCAYCGEKRPVTRDHIPPLSFFPKPRASDLITVPCCESCRAGWSDDDEYFRAVILSSARVSEEKIAQGATDALLRSLAKPTKQGFARMLLTSIKGVEIETEAGLYLGKHPVLKLEQERIARVAQRIIRGLFFREKAYRVPEGYEVLAYIQQFGIDPIVGELQGVQFSEPRVVQNGVFCYIFKETESDPNSSVWLALFYGTLAFVGFTRHPPELRTPHTNAF